MPFSCGGVRCDDGYWGPCSCIPTTSLDEQIAAFEEFQRRQLAAEAAGEEECQVSSPPQLQRVNVLCQCGWGLLAVDEEYVPEECPVCGFHLRALVWGVEDDE